MSGGCAPRPSIGRCSSVCSAARRASCAPVAAAASGSGAAPPRNDIPNVRPLSQRPASVTDRVEPGHWEGDLIIGRGQQSAIATLIERTSRFVVLVALPNGHKAPLVRDALITALRSVPAPLRKTLTWDRGRELFWHEQITAATGTPIFFADAHSPWLRGSNENAVSVSLSGTGLVRYQDRRR